MPLDELDRQAFVGQGSVNVFLIHGPRAKFLNPKLWVFFFDSTPENWHKMSILHGILAIPILMGGGGYPRTTRACHVAGMCV